MVRRLWANRHATAAQPSEKPRSSVGLALAPKVFRAASVTDRNARALWLSVVKYEEVEMVQRKTLKIRWLMVGAGAVVLSTVAPKPAAACGGAWFPIMEEQVDHRPMGIARAEKALDKGDAVAAAGMIIRMMPHIKTLDAKKSKLVARAQRVLAVAAARSGGALAVGDQVPVSVAGTWLGKTGEHRNTNLDWSIQALRTVEKTKKDDPAAQTELAEALAAVPAHRTEAREILEKLAKKDLIASPQGYAALATLRSAAGDEAGRKVALKRCEAMAAKAGVCRTAQG